MMVASNLLWEEKNIVQQAREMGIPLEVVRLRELCVENPVSHRNGTTVFMRIPGYFASLETSQSLEAQGCVVVNAARHISTFGRKTATDQWLLENALPWIKSCVLFSMDGIEKAEFSLSYPMVLKPVIGGFGKGVYRIESRKELQLIWEQLDSYAPAYHRILYLQKMIHVRYDLRVFLMNGRVLETIKRVNDGAFVKNLSTGGTAIVHELTPDEKLVTQQIAQKLPAGFFGVDLLVSQEGEVAVCEINAVPRFKESAKVSKCNFAEAIIKGLQEVSNP